MSSAARAGVTPLDEHFAELDLADRPSMLLGMKMLRMFDRVAIDFGGRHVDFRLPHLDWRSKAKPMADWVDVIDNKASFSSTRPA